MRIFSFLTRYTMMVALLSLITSVALAQAKYKIHCVGSDGEPIEIINRAPAVSSGDHFLDRLITRHLSELYRVFEINIPVYFLFDDPKDEMCFTKEVFTELIIADGGQPEEAVTGSIFISGLLLEKERELNGNFRSLPGYLAHEFAHGMQHQPISATPPVVYRLAFRSPRSFADVD